MRNLILLALFACVACKKKGGDDEVFTITAQPLQGTIAGSNWEFVSGGTDAFLSEGDDDFFTSLYGEDYDACGFEVPTEASLILQLPKDPSTYELSFSRNATFVVEEEDGPMNYIATDGTVRVDEVTETSVKGGVHMRYSDSDFEGEVDGEFEVEICPE